MRSMFNLLAVAMLFCAAMNEATAQSMKAGSTMLGIGVGYSNFNGYLYNSVQPSLELPELSATLDYFVIPNYSIGLGVAYQSASGSGEIYTYQYPNNGQMSFNESVNRVNVSVRSVVYFTKDMKPSF